MSCLNMDKLFSGMFSDTLDKMGYRDQVITGLRLNNPQGKIFGKVRTIKLETIETPDENIRTGLGFLETLDAGDVLFVEGSQEYAYFGELMSRISIRQQLGGVVIGGLTRDSNFTYQMTGLNIFAQGYSPKDIKGRGRVQAIDVPIQIKGVAMTPGDVAFGDSDGIVIIEQKLVQQVQAKIDAVLKDEADIIGLIDQGKSVIDILKNHNEF